MSQPIKDPSVKQPLIHKTNQIEIGKRCHYSTDNMQ